MRWLGGSALAAALGAALATTSCRPPAQTPEAVVGTWRLVSAKTNGSLADIPAGTTILKHVTPTDFVFVYYDQQGQVTVVGGGSYSRDGSRYEETVVYGLGEGMKPYIGKTQVFTLRIENGRWYQEGTESNGTMIEEVWERALPARS
jgi:hypothetical protein